jgi:hypothetical protein
VGQNTAPAIRIQCHGDQIDLPCPFLCDPWLDNFTRHISQPEIATLKAVSKTQVIEAELMK